MKTCEAALRLEGAGAGSAMRGLVAGAINLPTMTDVTAQRRPRRTRAGACLALAACMLLSDGCVALNSAGRPIGTPAHVTSATLCRRCLRPAGTCRCAMFRHAFAPRCAHGQR
jgi:hypothetical protein